MSPSHELILLHLIVFCVAIAQVELRRENARNWGPRYCQTICKSGCSSSPGDTVEHRCHRTGPKSAPTQVNTGGSITVSKEVVAKNAENNAVCFETFTIVQSKEGASKDTKEGLSGSCAVTHDNGGSKSGEPESKDGRDGQEKTGAHGESRSAPTGQPGRGDPVGQQGRGAPVGQPGRDTPVGQPGRGAPVGKPDRGAPVGKPGRGDPAVQRGRGGAVGQPGKGLFDRLESKGRGAPGGKPGRGSSVGKPGRGDPAVQRGRGGPVGKPGKGLFDRLESRGRGAPGGNVPGGQKGGWFGGRRGRGATSGQIYSRGKKRRIFNG